MHKSWKILGTLSLVALLGVGGLVVTLRGAGVAHASGTPTIVQSTGTQFYDNSRFYGSTEVISTLGTDATQGDELVALVSYAGGTNCDTVSFSDNIADTWTQQVEAQDSLVDTSIIATATVSGSVASSIYVNFGNDCGLSTGPFAQFAVTVLEVSGQGSEVSGTDSLTQNGSGGTTHATSGALATSSDDLDLAVYTDYGSDNTVSVPSGESLFGTTQDNTVNFQFALASASAQSAMEFDTSSSAAYATVAAISIPN